MAEYTKGQGPNALPQGGASALNEMGALALENTEIPVQFAGGEADDIPDDDQGTADDLQVLLQPPDPNRVRSALPRERPGRIPKYTVRHLAQFRAAATAPDAPPGLRALYNATIRQLDDERRRGR